MTILRKAPPLIELTKIRKQNYEGGAMLRINRLGSVNEQYEKAKAEGKIDEKCIPFCDILNRLGIHTDYCCEGHPWDDERDQNGETFHIIFSNILPDAEIFALISLMDEVSPLHYDRPFGVFQKFYRSIGGCLTSTWEYEIKISHEPLKSHLIEKEFSRFQRAEQLYLTKKKEREGDIFSPWK